MLTVGIAIEEWKLPMFSKVLKKKGYNYSNHPGVIPGSILLKVKVMEKDIDNFKKIVEAAQLKASQFRN